MPGELKAITVANLAVNYGPTVALDGASFTLGYGRICGLVGMNGSGKSTLFKAIMEMVTPRSGTVRLAGMEPTAARKAGVVGYVPQNEEVDWSFPVSVEDVVMMGRYGQMGFTRRPRAKDREAVDAALERVGLQDLRARQIGALSGGQRKRAFVARAIAQGATIMLLDEPFAGVDKQSEAAITEILHGQAEAGACLLVATHDLHTLPDLCDETILLLRHVLFHGPVSQALQPENLSRAFGMAPPDPNSSHLSVVPDAPESPQEPEVEHA